MILLKSALLGGLFTELLALAVLQAVTFDVPTLMLVVSNIVIVTAAFFTLKGRVDRLDEKVRDKEKADERLATLLLAPIMVELKALNTRLDGTTTEIDHLREWRHEMNQDESILRLRRGLDEERANITREDLRGRPRSTPRRNVDGPGGSESDPR
ncbi:MAG: hypothetical protein IT356_12490 [Gemmatimonadaceae bacterium]|nr:hypothetical protein [Gemmatimonadaceae bacterium]